MLQKQISVFLENKRGRLAEITAVLGAHDIDMGALCVADTTDFGILRIIVDKPDLAARLLKEKGFAVSITEVIAISVEDRPGGLAEALAVFDDCEINIEYIYHYVRKNEQRATVILRVENPCEAIKRLLDTRIDLLVDSDLTNARG